MDNLNESTGVSAWNRIQILTEEYRALYALLTFRLGAIDQRLPLAAGAIAALLASSPLLPVYQRLMLLLTVPIASLWCHRVVLLHTRSKEDVLRRIDEIEREVNRLASKELLAFQSRHPNRRRAVGGRSGFGSVLAIMSVCLLSVLTSIVLVFCEFETHRALFVGYLFYGAATAAELIRSTLGLSRYRYTKAPPSPRVDGDPLQTTIHSHEAELP